MKKKISHGEDTREALFRGAEKLVRTVTPAVGPMGRTVMAAAAVGAPSISAKCGSAAADISLPDVTENAGAILTRAAGEATRSIAGDGSGIAMLVTQSIISEGRRLIAAGHNPVFLRRGLEKALPAALGALRSLTISEPGLREICCVAALSANDEELGRLVAQALEKVGPSGTILVKASDTGKSYLYSDTSFTLACGYQSKYMVTNEGLQEAVFEDAAVFVCGCAINSVHDILPLLNEASISGRALLVLADSVSAEVVRSFTSNIAQGVIHICSVEAPGVGPAKRAWLEDAAVRTGTHVFGAELYPDTKAVTLKDCGSAGRVRVTRERTFIYDGGSDSADLSAYIKHLEALLRLEHNELEDEKLRQRIANLNGNTAQLRIGAITETERLLLTQKAESAILTAAGAARAGVLPGGGTAYLRAVSAVKALCKGLSGDEKAGAGILISALESPARAIISNAGYDAQVVIDCLMKQSGFQGFDAEKGIYADLLEAGILDSAQMLTTALETGVSAGAQQLTVEAAVLIDGTPISSLPVPDDLHLTPQDFM